MLRDRTAYNTTSASTGGVKDQTHNMKQAMETYDSTNPMVNIPPILVQKGSKKAGKTQSPQQKQEKWN